MKKDMQLTLTKSSVDPIVRLLTALTELINTFQESKKSFSDDFKFCRELRTKRKQFEKDIKKTLSCFHKLPETQQVKIEAAFYKTLKKLDKIVPKTIDQIDNDDLFFLISYFLKREVNKSYRFIKKHQVKMSAKLYPGTSKEILSDPQFYQKLVDAWGDVAD